MKASSADRPLIFEHLRVQRCERVDLAGRRGESVRRIEIFVAAGPPESAGGIDYERVSDAAAKDGGAVSANVEAARPRPLLGMLRHEVFYVADETVEEIGAFGGRSVERLADRAAEHPVGWRRH